MKREDLLLRIIAAAQGERLTPAQLQKVAFLLGKQYADQMPGDYYEFEKYHYGPFCAQLYRDAEELQRKGLIFIAVNSRGGWKEYAATYKGVAMDHPNVPAYIDTFIAQKVKWAMGLTFSQLVREIYIEFPEYRENSAFQY